MDKIGNIKKFCTIAAYVHDVKENTFLTEKLTSFKFRDLSLIVALSVLNAWSVTSVMSPFENVALYVCTHYTEGFLYCNGETSPRENYSQFTPFINTVPHVVTL